MKEVVMQTNALDLEQLRPDAGENALCVSARQITRLFNIDRKVRHRQRSSINYAIRRYRYRIEKDESRRNHVRRQTLSQKLSQLLRPALVFSFDYDICD